MQESAEPAPPWPEGSLRTVVDANVFARRDWMQAVRRAAEDGRIVPFWSPAIIAEVVRVLTWLWIRRNGGEVSEWARRAHSVEAHRWFSSMTDLFHVVEDRPPLAASWSDPMRDPHDAPIWTAAVRARAALVVTDNLRDGPPLGGDGLRSWRGIVYVSPDDLIRFLDAWRTALDEDASPDRSADSDRDGGDAGSAGLAESSPRLLALLRAIENRPRAVGDPPRGGE
ncbi:MAG: PIN domain-containing protein [Acidobacteria bacterium]|nr:PIN domain-containing protein [Acidobacteriota bacterium]